MSLERNFEATRNKHPDISELELHFYNMKYRGIKDPGMASGGDRPIFYMFDDANFGLISFMLSEDGSPYRLEKDRILFQEEELPFQSPMFVRLGNTLPRYYFRGPLGTFPSLHDDNILNVNFHPKCGGCDFCFYGYRAKQLKNITPEQGFQKIEAETGFKDLGSLKEVAVVTGRFNSEDALKQHILDVIDQAEERGFDKRIFYIGSQLVTPADIEEISRRLGNDPNRFRYAYTVERFSDRRSIMHGSKGRKTYPEIVQGIKDIKDLGVVGTLEYTYIVGIEDLDAFKKGAEVLVPLATPHLSIIRKTGQGANSLTLAADYLELGPDYTCQVREYYEELYGGRIIGNNFANLWPFPLSEFNLLPYLDRLHS